MTAYLLMIGLFIIFQGFFSGSEIALVSANRLKLQAEAESGQRSSRLALELLAEPAKTLGACLIGTNLCVVSSATLAAKLVQANTDMHESVAALLIVPFTLTFGEMVPKAFYQQNADRLVPWLVYPLRMIAAVLAPALWFLDWLAVSLTGGAVAPTGPSLQGDLCNHAFYLEENLHYFFFENL